MIWGTAWRCSGKAPQTLHKRTRKQPKRLIKRKLPTIVQLRTMFLPWEGMKCNIPCASGWQVTEFFNQTRPKAGAISMPKQLGDSKASNSTAAWWMPLSFPAGRSGWLVVPWLHDVDAACYDTPKNARRCRYAPFQYTIWFPTSKIHVACYLCNLSNPRFRWSKRNPFKFSSFRLGEQLW